MRARWQAIGLGLVLAVAVWAAFAGSCRNGFVNYDDDVYVYANPFVQRGFSPATIQWAFTSVAASNWHPLTWLSHMLDCRLFGLKAGAHHRSSVLIHGATVLLLFGALTRLTGARWRSFFVALFFAIHPLRVESVAWVAERKDVLSGFFFALTLLAYAEGARRPGPWWRRQGWVGLAFALGLMAKPSLVTLPGVLLLLDFWPLRRFADWGPACRGCLLEKLPLGALSVASSVITLFAQRGEIGGVARASLGLRLGNALVAVACYVRDTFWPFGLTPLYPFPDAGLPGWEVAVSAVLVLTVSLAALRWRERFPAGFVGWFWFLGVLVPMIGFVQVGGQARADRYTYLAQIGWLIALVWLVAQATVALPRRRWVLAGLAGSLALFSITLSRAQVTRWKDGKSLWTYTLAHTAGNPIAEDNLGVQLAIEGDLPGAVAHFRRAADLRPTYAEAFNNLGRALMGLGQPGEARIASERAVALNPKLGMAHNNLGLILIGEGGITAAMAEFNQALAIDPQDAQALNNLGIAYFREREFGEAVRCFERSLAINPSEPSTQRNLEQARRRWNGGQ